MNVSWELFMIMTRFHAISRTPVISNRLILQLILIWFVQFFSVHNLYPQAQPTVYPPPPNPHGQDQYQSYFGEENPSYGWPEHPPPTAQSQGPFQHGYQEDADCITFLRGWYVCFSAFSVFAVRWCVHVHGIIEASVELSDLVFMHFC